MAEKQELLEGRGLRKMGGENSPISPPLDPRLKGVNNQPYLDIRTYVSHLTKSNSFPYHRFPRLKTHFETKAQGNIHP